MTAQAPPATTDPNWRTVRFEVLEKLESLPSLNSVVLEFLELSKREYFTATDFEAVICKDLALAARVLKLANSGLYGRSRTITSIPEAVVRIGLESLKKIVFAVSTEGLTKTALTSYDYHVHHGFWVHSLGVAHSCRVLVEGSSLCSMRSEEAFVAGLLHDVGKLVINDFLPLNEGEAVTREAEIEAVGMDHSELASHILRQWNLPESITACVCFHHDYRSGGEHAKAAAVLNLAEEVCSHWGLGRRHPIDLSEEAPPELFRQTLDDLGLPVEKWDQVIWDIRQNLVGLDETYGEFPD